MKCQICYKRKATTTVFDKDVERRLQVCSTCKKFYEYEEETPEEVEASERAAEFNAELGAGVYDLP